MPRLSLGLGVQAVSRIKSSGGAAITTSKAFNSIGVQVGSTNTGAIPSSWVESETTVTSVIFANDNSVTSIGSGAFGYCNLSGITIPNSVTNIGSGAFKYNSNLSTITLPTNVNFTSIESFTFFQCVSLTSITIPSSVTSISAYAFKNCGLTSITIPNAVQSIGSYAFGYSGGLVTATIGTGVTSIDSSAFRYCTSLATVLCRVAQSAFTGSDAFGYTASPLVIQARITDASWTAGVGLTFQGNTNVTVIKNL